MLTFIETEFLKLKRSKILILSILGSLAPQLMLLIGIIHHKMTGQILTYTFSEICNEIMLYFLMLIGVVICSLIISYLFSNEFREHTVKSILTSPISRNKYIISKIVMFIIWTLILSVIGFMSTSAVGLITSVGEMTLNVFSQYLIRFTQGGLLLALSMTPFAVLGLVFKNVVPGVIGGVVLSLANSIIYTQKWAPLFPWCSPLIYARGEMASYSYGNLTPVAIIAITAIIGVILALSYFNLSDVKI